MSLGLPLTGSVAWVVGSTPSLAGRVPGNPVLFYGAFVAELVLVLVFAARASRM